LKSNISEVICGAYYTLIIPEAPEVPFLTARFRLIFELLLDFTYIFQCTGQQALVGEALILEKSWLPFAIGA
jgi:hypothetical protein